MSLVPFRDGAFCLTHTPLNIDTCFNMPAFQFCPKGHSTQLATCAKQNSNFRIIILMSLVLEKGRGFFYWQLSFPKKVVTLAA